MKRLPFIAALVPALVPALHAQSAADQDLSFQILPTGEKILNWTGHLDRSYFIQASPDLSDWTWAPNIERGILAPMSYEVDGPTAAGFFRLQYTDQTAVDLDAADFDGDGFTNLYEITPRPRPGGIVGFIGLNPNIQTNPLRIDTDGDGLSDKWEEDHGLDPTDDGTRSVTNGPNGDPDQDGVTNLTEQTLGTDPEGNATTTDSDGDGTLDFEDAMPGYNLVSWKRTPESSYVLIEIETPSSDPYPRDLNEKGEVLFTDGIWSAGNWIPRIAAPTTGADPESHTYDLTYQGWFRFNNDKRLLGYSHLAYNDGSQAAGGDGLDSPSFWPLAQSTPSILLETANLWENPHSSFTPIGVSDNGNLIVRTRRQDGTQTMERYDSYGALIAQMDGTQDFHPNGGWGHGDSTASGWVASNLTHFDNGQPTSSHKVALWNDSNSPIALPVEANGWGYPVSTKDLPNDKVVLTAGAGTGTTTTGRVFLPNPSGQYEYATKLADKKIQLFAGDGSALTTDNKLWRNGNLTLMGDLCARYKELLQSGSTIQPLRSNSDGTYLVQVESQAAGPPVVSSALLAPIEVKWQAITGFDNVDDHIDPWTPGKKNGQRIFPDYKNPADTEIRHKLELVVKTSPSLAGKVVWVKAFDVDDSTWETFDKDPNTAAPVVDTNGKAGDDNLVDYLNTPGNGQFWDGSAWAGNTAQGTVDANGDAKFVFRVGMQPGSNYRVAASLVDESMYAGVQTANPSNAKYLGPEASETGGAPVSPLLTVWRRLWVENDSMEAIPEDSYGYKRNDLSAKITNPTIRSVALTSSGGVVATRLGISQIDNKISFRNLEDGVIIVQGVSHKVIGTTIENEEVNYELGSDSSKFFVQISGDFSSIPVDSEFRLYDDDDLGLDSPALPKLGLVSNQVKEYFRPSFIEVTDAVIFNANKTVPLHLNEDVAESSYGPTQTVVDDSKNLSDKNESWVCPVTAAYQSAFGEDRDPSSSPHFIPGETANYGSNQEPVDHSTVFVETCREVYNIYFRSLVPETGVTARRLLPKLIAADVSHEMGHQPGLQSEDDDHAELGLMAVALDGVSILKPENASFTPQTIKRFRKSNRWSK